MGGEHAATALNPHAATARDAAASSRASGEDRPAAAEKEAFARYAQATMRVALRLCGETVGQGGKELRGRCRQKLST